MTALERLIDTLLLTTQSRRNHQAAVERDERLAQELKALQQSTKRLCKELECRPPAPVEDPKASRLAAFR